jgi:hypothetical protein
MLCFCGREARGFYYQRPAPITRVSRKHPTPAAASPKIRCCSLACLDVAHKRGGVMPTLSKFEKIALAAVSSPAGSYIEAVGNTDMATWSVETWDGFLECIVIAYTRKMRELVDSDEPPF